MRIRKDSCARNAPSFRPSGAPPRNVDGQVILYADRITDSVRRAVDETERRRSLQTSYNVEHHITPETVRKKISDVLSTVYEADYYTVPVTPAAGISEEQAEYASRKDLEALMKGLEKKMKEAGAVNCDSKRPPSTGTGSKSFSAWSWTACERPCISYHTVENCDLRSCASPLVTVAVEKTSPIPFPRSVRRGNLRRLKGR